MDDAGIFFSVRITADGYRLEDRLGLQGFHHKGFSSGAQIKTTAIKSITRRGRFILFLLRSELYREA
jgi:hypothetical protein